MTRRKWTMTVNTGTSSLRPSGPMSTPTPITSVPTAEPARRALTAAGLIGVAVVHLIDAPGKFEETPT
jgi:hypothetical protein